MLQAVIDHGGARAAARALGVDPAYPAAAHKAVKAKAARRGYAPDASNMKGGAPEGFTVRRHSARFDKEGKPAGGWLISEPDAERQVEARQAAFAAMAAELPRLPPVRAPEACEEHLATLYTLTDCHVGMLAQEAEGGADWDLKIAERTLVGCFQAMIAAAPNSGLGVVNQLGDWLHWDGLVAVTPTSGHSLDADGRFAKLVDVSIRILRQVIDMALAKHGRIHVIMAEGNHDLASSVWLRKMFAVLYENEPRVTVDDSPLPYYALRHGRTMLAFHHGHLKKNDQLPLLFAAQFSRMWGETTRRYCHTGHRHHVEEKEHSGMIVTQHPTLAARDAYAARGGWISDRAATAITYHAEFGQVGRVTVTPEMLARG